MFRRMQYSAFATGALIYAAAGVHAWRVLPGRPVHKLEQMVLWPGVLFLFTLVAPLAAPPLRRALKTHIWISFRTGFGQSVISVLAGVGVLIALAGFIFWQIHDARGGGRYPGGAFSGYAAGIGLLIAQAILLRRIEADPELRWRIEE